MALFSGLDFLGSLLGGGRNERAPRQATAEERKSGTRPRRPGAPITGTAITREEFARRQAEGAVDATKPPNTVKNESQNVSDARALALRARRRAAAGNAGKVRLPGGTNAGMGGAPRTLLGY